MGALGYYNGQYGPIEQMVIPMNDRVVYFGDGVYEAALVKNRVIFALQEHVDRFWRSFGALRIPFRMTREELEAELYKMVDAMNTEDTLLLYWQVSRGTAPRSHAFPKEGTANLLITVKEIQTRDMETFRHRLITLEDTRFLHCDIKTLNLIPSVMASQRAEEAGCTEAVLHRGDRVTECAHSNISILKDGILQTAPCDNLILPGITRMHLLQLARELSIPVMEKPFSMAQLMEADEVLVTSSSALCLRTEQIDGQPVRQRDSLRAQALQKAYEEKFRRETEPEQRK